MQPDTGFNLATRSRDDHYGFRFEGLIEIQETGVYNFFTNSDDGSRLYIDDSLVVDNDGLHGMQEAGGAIPLLKGMHRITVDYFEKTGTDNLKIFFKGPGFDRMPVPSGILFHRKEKKQGKYNYPALDRYRVDFELIYIFKKLANPHLTRVTTAFCNSQKGRHS